MSIEAGVRWSLLILRSSGSAACRLLPCFLLVGRHLDNLRAAAVVDRSCRLQPCDLRAGGLNSGQVTLEWRGDGQPMCKRSWPPDHPRNISGRRVSIITEGPARPGWQWAAPHAPRTTRMYLAASVWTPSQSHLHVSLLIVSS